MIDLFTIFGKGGIVLWCFQEGSQLFGSSINQLISEVFLQERGNNSVFRHNGLTIKFKLDNEFELIFLMAYQDIVQLSYADKLLSDIQLEFRDRYKNILGDSRFLWHIANATFENFNSTFEKCLKSAQERSKESSKSKKTIDSMIIRPSDKNKSDKTQNKSQIPLKKTDTVSVQSLKVSNEENELDIAKNRDIFFKKMTGQKKEKAKQKIVANDKTGKKGKQNRIWELSGTNVDSVNLDYSKPSVISQAAGIETEEDQKFIEEHRQFVGHYKGQLPGLDDQTCEMTDEESNDEQTNEGQQKHPGGWFSAFKSLVGNKKLTQQDIQPALQTMKDHLIAKNVAVEIAAKLCSSVEFQLDGKVIGSFARVGTSVRGTLRHSLVQLLTPKRRVDILRDVAQARANNRPYSIVFCGVNGVGKSTNLAKISFWLAENGYRILIVAGDTFRAGAVEQLRTHTKHLNALHDDSVQLYEQGYGKDPAALTAHAFAIASERGFDVVLVDTAGRMQDNEPLMRSLAKLIKINSPDLVLFVGEALVGNEAVDQLIRFDQALADHADPGVKGRLIDGIVLTKFDTIDDKVGAAISMTYITGQPIVFVGTGQTYKDLKNLNVNALVSALLK